MAYLLRVKTLFPLCQIELVLNGDNNCIFISKYNFCAGEATDETACIIGKKNVYPSYCVVQRFGTVSVTDAMADKFALQQVNVLIF